MAQRYTVIIDRDAYADLIGIQKYVSEVRDPEFAAEFVAQIVRFCMSLRTIPHRGTRLDALRPNVRTVGWRRTVTIAFQVFDESKSVVVLGVFYRGRDVLSALRKRAED
jgi:toxin ParE1/3/4